MSASQTQHRISRFRGQGGFTLLELMVAVSVAAIILAYAVPNMHSFLERNRAVAQSNNVMADLQYARGQAVTTHGYVSVCPLAAAGGTTCDTADGNYNQGWIVFTTAAPGTAYNGVATNLLRVEAAPTTTSVTAKATGILTYDAFGQLWAGGLVAATTFSVCAVATNGSVLNTTTVPGKQLSVSSSGRVAAGTLVAGASCS